MNTTPEKDLPALRQEIRRVDEEMAQLIARRMNLARQVGEYKLAHQLPIKDYRVEKEIITGSRNRARELGFYEDLAEEISKSLIKYSCLLQDEYHGRSRRRAEGISRKILIVGGLGPMGGWLADFFDSFGHAVEVSDIREPVGDGTYPFRKDMIAAAKTADVVVLATPISATAQTIAQLADSGTRALVFDICSLKSPLIHAFEKATEAGLRLTSIHPMFGPKVDILAGRNLVLCETGDPALTDEVESLFKECTANLVRLPFSIHDEYVSYILGLSHLASLVFASTVSKSGVSFPQLQHLGSTTFMAQTQVTEAVVRENQDLYYEIQSENRFTPQLLDTMRHALDEYAHAITEHKREEFKKIMESSRRYFNPNLNHGNKAK